LGNYLNIIKHQLVVMRGEMGQLPQEQQNLWTERLAHSLDNIGYYEWRMTQLIENLDLVAHLENPKTVFPFTEVKPDVIVDDVVRDLHERAQARRVELSWWARPELFPRITANHDALRQALINLIDNALKHSPEGGTVLCQTGFQVTYTDPTCRIPNPHKNLGSHIWISVRDLGPGIPSEDQQKIFERFYRRGSELRRETQGVGIGLSIVQHIIDAHQGVIQVESQPGHGSQFTLRIPVRGPASGVRGQGSGVGEDCRPASTPAAKEAKPEVG
jgi:signal transduction histidine kinase